jgi:DNA-3-methyladenine glycosylase I
MKATERVRCPWSGIADGEYARYHDEEWGVPLYDDRALFEKIVLEGFQSGLSWLTILKKRENFRRAFDGFEPTRMARYDKSDIARLMGDAGIVRHRQKIEAAIANARALLRLRAHTSLAAFLWGYLDGRPLINRHRSARTVPAATALSAAMSQGLKAHGFQFVGPTTMYAFMQAAGMVNDHIVSCHRYAPCAALQRAFQLPEKSPGTGGHAGGKLGGTVSERSPAHSPNSLPGKPAVARSGNATGKRPRGAR